MICPAAIPKIAKYLYDHFKKRFAEELERMRPQESPVDALRRTYLGLNKDLAIAATQGMEKGTTNSPQHRGPVPELSDDDLQSGMSQLPTERQELTSIFHCVSWIVV